MHAAPQQPAGPPAPPVQPVVVPPPATTPPAPVPHGHTAAEEAAKEVQDNALYRGMLAFWKRAKSGQLIPSKVLAVILLVALAVGLWWWFSGQSKKSDSARWTALAAISPTDNEGLAKFAEENPNTSQALSARRTRALNLLTDGQEKIKGRAKVPEPDKPVDPAEASKLKADAAKVKADRAKAVTDIETARDEFVKLAEASKKDKLLKSANFRDAAIAERSLLGVPKQGMADNRPENSRGSAAKVAEYYREAAKAIGAATKPGEECEAQAKAAETKGAEWLTEGSYYYAQLASSDPADAPKPAPDPKTPAPTPTPDPKTPGTNPKK